MSLSSVITNFNLRSVRELGSLCSKEKRNGSGHRWTDLCNEEKWEGQVDIATKNMFCNDAYLINYSTDHITTKLIRKIDLKLSIHLFNFNHIFTEITIKTNGRQGNSEFYWTLDWWTAYNFLILINVRGPIS